jgi:RepB DNA-primase from phage plasmid
VRVLWEDIFGEVEGVLALFFGVRSGPGSKVLQDTRTVYVDYPRDARRAEKICASWSAEGRETYFCAHLLTARRRVKANAAPLLSLYVDGDGAKLIDELPRPSAVVESSPGRGQFYFRLTEPISPQIGERLNRRLALAMGADDSGWDLTQLLRPPGSRNYKYPDAPPVRLVELNGLRHDPDELDRMLPEDPDVEAKSSLRASRPVHIGRVPDLSSLSPRIRELILHGNRGEYGSRSNADMAVCVAMFGSGYTEADVWAVMTDPTNGISEKFIEKRHDGERYLALTIGKAAARARTTNLRVGRSRARRLRSRRRAA